MSGESTLAQTSVIGVVYVIESGVSSEAEGLQICIAVDVCPRLTGRCDIHRGHRVRVAFAAGLTASTLPTGPTQRSTGGRRAYSSEAIAARASSPALA